MAFTQAQLDALERAIAQGSLKVKEADREVTYRSLREMNTIAGQMRRALGLTKPKSRNCVHVYKRSL